MEHPCPKLGLTTRQTGERQVVGINCTATRLDAQTFVTCAHCCSDLRESASSSLLVFAGLASIIQYDWFKLDIFLCLNSPCLWINADPGFLTCLDYPIWSQHPVR